MATESTRPVFSTSDAEISLRLVLLVLCRCDVRNNTRAAIVVALLSWLKDIGQAPPAKDLVVVVGTTRGKVSGRAVLVLYFVFSS